jgi:hypothetical protein
VAAWTKRQSKYMLFLTFTFPFDVKEIDASKVWHLLLKSLYKTYNVKNYVWVKENQKNGRVHYHLLIDTGHINIKALQSTYNNCICHVFGECDTSNNSVRLGNNPTIRNITSISRYLSKYISKEPEIYTRRASGWSELELYNDYDTAELLVLLKDMNVYCKTIYVSDMFSVYILLDFPAKLELFQKVFSQNIQAAA